jgi:hypothetical protein
MVKSNNWEAVLIGIFCVVMGLVATTLSGSIFNFFFVPIVIAVLYDYSNKLNDMREKLSEMESKLGKEVTTNSSSS